MSSIRRIVDLGPGLALAALVTLVAWGVERLEVHVLGNPFVDALVVAILLGTTLHTGFGLHPRARAGVHFASKSLLELAIVLLGASISFRTIEQAGGRMIAVVALVVLLSLVISYTLSRLLGLPDKLATLVACGNSICGNSAIVAAAPVIDARPEDVASSISFTAALGILVVLLLPLCVTVLGLNQWQYGVAAGLTVYAVPQVLAATHTIGVASVQIGTVVKLMRVLMLGPVVILLGLRSGRVNGRRPALRDMLPWFIIGFLLMMGLHSFDLIPAATLGPLQTASTVLTVLSMAALGLSVDLRAVMTAGGRVLAAGTLSLIALGCLSAVALHLI
ncbi:MAG: putative sulfate exporter family transporter [Pseudorhodoplanes sp.]